MNQRSMYLGQYLQAYCEPMSACSSCHLWSISSSLLAIPRIQTNYGDRSFAVYGLRVWSGLSGELRSSDITDYIQKQTEDVII